MDSRSADGTRAVAAARRRAGGAGPRGAARPRARPRQGRGDVEEPRRAVGARSWCGWTRTWWTSTPPSSPACWARCSHEPGGRATSRRSTGARLGDDEDDGGRVTEICARPLINLFYPELAGFAQPLSGEAAGRRDLLRSVPFFSGYAVELGLLIDLAAHAGLGALAQVDLGRRTPREPADRRARGDGLGHRPGGAAPRGGRGARARGGACDGDLRAARPRRAAATCWASSTRGRAERPPMAEAASVRA